MPSDEGELAVVMREAMQICIDLGWSPEDRPLFERAVVAVRNGILQGMTMARHEDLERLQDAIRRVW